MNSGYSQIIEIPMGSKCPDCNRPKSSIRKLVRHHLVNTDTNTLYAYEICNSCNLVLGHKYHNDYPVWEEQLRYLDTYWKERLIRHIDFRSIPGSRGFERRIKAKQEINPKG